LGRGLSPSEPPPEIVFADFDPFEGRFKAQLRITSV
jgi:hypothetical protein